MDSYTLVFIIRAPKYVCALRQFHLSSFNDKDQIFVSYVSVYEEKYSPYIFLCPKYLKKSTPYLATYFDYDADVVTKGGHDHRIQSAL